MHFEPFQESLSIILLPTIRRNLSKQWIEGQSYQTELSNNHYFTLKYLQHNMALSQAYEVKP